MISTAMRHLQSTRFFGCCGQVWQLPWSTNREHDDRPVTSDVLRNRWTCHVPRMFSPASNSASSRLSFQILSLTLSVFGLKATLNDWYPIPFLRHLVTAMIPLLDAETVQIKPGSIQLLSTKVALGPQLTGYLYLTNALQ